jgi:glycosyltransferase involved in cell wall biosynthesis
VVQPDNPQAYAEAVRRAYQERDRLPAEGEAGLRYVQRGYTKEAVGLEYDRLVRQLVRRAA